MLKIEIQSYDECEDDFQCQVEDSLSETTYEIRLDASLMPYIATDLCRITEDLPHGLCGQSFELKADFDR